MKTVKGYDTTKWRPAVKQTRICDAYVLPPILKMKTQCDDYRFGAVFFFSAKPYDTLVTFYDRHIPDFRVVRIHLNDAALMHEYRLTYVEMIILPDSQQRAVRCIISNYSHDIREISLYTAYFRRRRQNAYC